MILTEINKFKKLKRKYPDVMTFPVVLHWYMQNREKLAEVFNFDLNEMPTDKWIFKNTSNLTKDLSLHDLFHTFYEMKRKNFEDDSYLYTESELIEELEVSALEFSIYKYFNIKPDVEFSLATLSSLMYDISILIFKAILREDKNRIEKINSNEEKPYLMLYGQKIYVENTPFEYFKKFFELGQIDEIDSYNKKNNFFDIWQFGNKIVRNPTTKNAKQLLKICNILKVDLYKNAEQINNEIQKNKKYLEKEFLDGLVKLIEIKKNGFELIYFKRKKEIDFENHELFSNIKIIDAMTEIKNNNEKFNVKNLLYYFIITKIIRRWYLIVHTSKLIEEFLQNFNENGVDLGRIEDIMKFIYDVKSNNIENLDNDIKETILTNYENRDLHNKITFNSKYGNLTVRYVTF